MNLYSTIKTLATLDISNMSASEKRSTLKRLAAEIKQTPNALVNLIRDARELSLQQPHVPMMQLDNAVTKALIRVALFNARRCYHS